MEKTDNFSEIKQEILDRARRAEACYPEYGRAAAAETLGDLCTVIKDNFNWCCRNGVIDAPLLEKYKSDFAACDIYVNTDAERGFMLCDGNATVDAWNDATVVACGNAKVVAYDNATVDAWNDATVAACGNAKVKAYDNATVKAWNNAKVKACGNATVVAYGNTSVEACGNAKVKAWNNATVEAYGNTTVEAWNNAYCSSCSLIECKLSDNALYRVQSTNTVYYANDSMKFRKQEGGAG